MNIGIANTIAIAKFAIFINLFPFAFIIFRYLRVDQLSYLVYQRGEKTRHPHIECILSTLAKKHRNNHKGNEHTYCYCRHYKP